MIVFSSTCRYICLIEELKPCMFYRLSKDDVLTIDYTATTTKACPLNLTNHSYFNLGGQVCMQQIFETLHEKTGFCLCENNSAD